jgi:predicted protein tyrosine phosphatase
MIIRHVLFICSRNQLRSPTAEHVFSSWPGIEVASAGLEPSSSAGLFVPLTLRCPKLRWGPAEPSMSRRSQACCSPL